jgi:hypothetical protein
MRKPEANRPTPGGELDFRFVNCGLHIVSPSGTPWTRAHADRTSTFVTVGLHPASALDVRHFQVRVAQSAHSPG